MKIILTTINGGVSIKDESGKPVLASAVNLTADIDTSGRFVGELTVKLVDCEIVGEAEARFMAINPATGEFKQVAEITFIDGSKFQGV